MSKKENSNVPSAVGTNRTYGLVILENLRNGWEAIKSNTYVNMFVPLEAATEGNTLAVVTSAVPGKQAVTTAGKAILGNVDEVVKPARKVIRPGAKKAGDFIEDGIEYTAYGSSQPGTPLYFPVPKSEVTRGKPQWIPTLEEVAEAIAKHTSSAKKAVSDGVRRATDWAATLKANIQRLDRKLARLKDPSEMTRVNNTAKRQGISPDKSIFPKVSLYLEDYLASSFTPSAASIRTNNFDKGLQEWFDHLAKMKYDTKSKDSVDAITKIFLKKWGTMYKLKQGGILNYLNLFK